MFRAVIGVIGNDIHVVAIKLLEIALQDYGFKVYNLGVSTKPEEFVDAVSETSAHLLLISSINGEAAGWVYNIKELLKQKGNNRTILAIGGNLSVGEANQDDVEKKFKDFGFNFVFHQRDIESSLKDVVKYFNTIK